MSRRYDPKERATRHRTDFSKDRKFTDARVAWTVIDWFTAAYYHRDAGSADDPDPDDTGVDRYDEPGDQHSLVFYTQRRKFTLGLDRMTTAEIDTLKHFINAVLDTARDECLRRDRLAQEAYEHGDDSFARQYRVVPQVIVRAWPESEHGPRLPRGSHGLESMGKHANRDREE